MTGTRITRASIRAPAKINLTLEVVKRLPDGYHALRSVMLTLPDVADDLLVEAEAGAPQIVIRTSSPDVMSTIAMLSTCRPTIATSATVLSHVICTKRAHACG